MVLAMIRDGPDIIIRLWLPRKKTAVRRLINRILAYSATNRIANPPLLYSTLNPETSSDSPSAKSKGARLVSAKIVINHITKNGSIKQRNQTLLWDGPKVEKL